MNLANIVVFTTKTKYFLPFLTITNFVLKTCDSNFSSQKFSDSRCQKSENISNSCLLPSYTKKIEFLSLFCGCTSLGLDKIMLDCLISVALLLWNRLWISDTFFTFLQLSFLSRTKKVFAVVPKSSPSSQIFKICTIYLAGEVLQFYMHYYKSGKSLPPPPTHIVPRKPILHFSCQK